MNERIKELTEQSDMALKPRRPFYDENPNGYLESDNDFILNNIESILVFLEGGLEKFVELIVQECIDVVEDAVLHREPASTYVAKIKEHFGIKE